MQAFHCSPSFTYLVLFQGGNSHPSQVKEACHFAFAYGKKGKLKFEATDTTQRRRDKGQASSPKTELKPMD